MKIFKTGGKETMKKRRFAQLVLVITMLFCLTFGTVYVQAQQQQPQQPQKQPLKMAGKKRAVSIITT